ncbi:calmodulin-lysine N-methyltransferase isoform X4 [Cephus cinctus]|uniref:Calmodulin-lysine N-methyltransferase n=1 Tax=Cephus cinctus TaxID=211228 RepID=A0AAJ7RTJ9_CEPCN|nr:calmodulin-lysine N-methyltransferase isoform X4 [Cephus cinctus]XP_024946186.1 calmodulin-lysine N-methyltransferase isoform X4 [Cephus cinctus]
MSGDVLVKGDAGSCHPKESHSTAQRRWRLLARALTRSPEPFTETEDEISMRRFTSFGLVNPVILENAVTDPESSWYEYSAVVDSKIYSAEIRRINKNFTANELIGFNNTGNVCVWPSEECLAYYLMKNRRICKNKMVLELGGGMSCLAGVFAAKYCSPSGVTLTDGNVTSVDNARCIIARNDMADFIKCGVVQWARAARVLRQAGVNGNRVQTWVTEAADESRRTEGLYDVILSADCLFFDDARLDLVETIYGWLADGGVALVMAPRRGTTFQKFTEAAIKRGFITKQWERYDPVVWSRHLELLNHNPEYCPDLHYPLLLELTKQKLPGKV